MEMVQLWNLLFTFKDLYEPNANELLKGFIKDVLESHE